MTATEQRQPTLTERRAAELKLTIARAARELFIASGDTSATVGQICDVVGVNPRTFHRHFPVKEDVLTPLFTERAKVILGVMEEAEAGSDPVETLTLAFTTEVESRGSIDADRGFMRVVVDDVTYRLRWLQWWEQFREPITDFLATRIVLPTDPFMRQLPAELLMQASRLIYLRWVETGDFSETESLHRLAFTKVLRGFAHEN